MKYGETLRQRSIAAWSHHNIDYDDIKRIIKEETTPGKGKSISVPGRTDDKLLEFENSLFNILSEQHHRIDLFVRSKAGEIQRRIDHSKKQLRQLSARTIVSADQRVSLSRLERYGRLENDILKAGEEIKSLARFTSTQRTAFRKLLKKFKKWTGSTTLDDRFQDEILSDPKSFTNIDLGALLDDYSDTLVAVRELYEDHVRQPAYRKTVVDPEPAAGSSVIAQLQTAVDSASKVDFDTAIGAVPLGEAGTFASYFVHPDAIVELLMLLLNHTRSYSAKSRQSSLNSPAPTPRKSSTPSGQAPVYDPDYFAIAADDLDRFVQSQTSLTVDDREHGPGAQPQGVRLCARWNNDEDAQVCARSSRSSTKCAPIKRKHIESFFDTSVPFPTKTSDQHSKPNNAALQEIRAEVEKDSKIRALYRMSACRSRFVGLNNSAKGAVFATLDTSLSFQSLSSKSDGDRSVFPFAVLSVREEGIVSAGLLTALADCHLVERVRGFSMELHGCWDVCRPKSIPAPFWIPILSRDIRKLPPPAAAYRGSSSAEASSSLSATQASDSTASGRVTTDSNTAHDTGLDTPGLRDSFTFSEARWKRRQRAYPEARIPQQQYWNEYDNPEEGDERDAYVIYIDPNEKSAFDVIIEKLGRVFKQRPRKADSVHDDSDSPTTPRDEDSSDEETGLLTKKSGRPAYGTVSMPFGSSYMATEARRRITNSLNPTLTIPCYIASIAVLIVAYFLAFTGRKRYHAEVEAGVFFAIICSIVFAIVGFVSLCRQQTIEWPAWALATTVLIIETLGAGGLLAGMLGSSLVPL